VTRTRLNVRAGRTALVQGTCARVAPAARSPSSAAAARAGRRSTRRAPRAPGASR
jgi:hypothetical protein